MSRSGILSSIGSVGVVFAGVLVLAAIAYSSMAVLVNWLTVVTLGYPVDGVAPFVVITGAILTIPIVVPTVLVSMKLRA